MSSDQNGPLRPTAKRSPSILVTDSRLNNIKGTRAPFAGQNFRKQQQQQQYKSPPPTQGVTQPRSHSTKSALYRRFSARSNKYTDISVDKLLNYLSDIPSGQNRFPPLTPTHPYSPPQRSGSPTDGAPPFEAADARRKNIRSIPKLTLNLPTRTSKTSQRLVLIPDQYSGSQAPRVDVLQAAQDPRSAELQFQLQRSRAELMAKELRAKEFSRVTAYYICEEIKLSVLADFLTKVHNVKPRLYDEALYVPYTLPLLPGSDGFRVKSNDTAKSFVNKQLVEKMINKSEQTDHLYEYYSGVETPEDANNYSMDPENGTADNSGPFDPSEPQFFAPPKDISVEASSVLGREESDTSPTMGEAGDKYESDDRLVLWSSSDSGVKDLHTRLPDDPHELLKHHAEMFVLEYGIVVFWNLSETHEKNVLADLAFAYELPEPFIINAISQQDIETEEFHFEYDSQIHRPRIYNDMITLRSGDHLIKLTMSYAIAQLTKLCLFESRMVHSLQLISKLPKKLALTGHLGLKRQQLLKKSGKLFKLRVDVNLSSPILDTPDFFWNIEPALHPLYNAVREYLEIEQRVQVLNDRCKVFLEFLNIIRDSINESNTKRITMMIIVIMFLSLGVNVFEFFTGLI